MKVLIANSDLDHLDWQMVGDVVVTFVVVSAAAAHVVAVDIGVGLEAAEAHYLHTSYVY